MDLRIYRPINLRMEVEMAPAQTFWDKVADKYAASPIKNVPAYEQTMERTRSYLSKEHDALEFGCGTGSTALLLAPHVNHLTATDMSRRMIEIGRAKSEQSDAKNITFAQADLPDPSLETAGYDRVMCFNTLHLIRDLDTALGSLHRSLKPGGMLISKTVCLAEQTRLWSIPITLLRLIGKAPYVNMLTFDQLNAAMVGAGFEVVETGVYPAPFSRFLVCRKL